MPGSFMQPSNIRNSHFFPEIPTEVTKGMLFRPPKIFLFLLQVGQRLDPSWPKGKRERTRSLAGTRSLHAHLLLTGWHCNRMWVLPVHHPKNMKEAPLVEKKVCLILDADNQRVGRCLSKADSSSLHNSQSVSMSFHRLREGLHVETV